MRALTTDIVVVRARQTHGDKYSYDNFVYINKRVKAIVTCGDHGDFEQLPLAHATGQGCPSCAYIIAATKRAYTYQEFIQMGRKAHGDLYDYSKTEYVRSQQYVTIICRRHGEFSQNAHSHTLGIGCPKCGWEKSGLKGRSTQEQYIADCVARHGDVYDYRKTVYTVGNEKVIVTCKMHGDFFQVAAISWLAHRSRQDGVHIEHALNGGERTILHFS